MGGFASGFFPGIAGKLDEKVKEHKDNDRRMQDIQAQIYLDSLHSGELSPAAIQKFKQENGREPTQDEKNQMLQLQHQQALTQLQKIYGNSKPLKDLFQKFGTVLTLGHRFNQAQSQGGGQPMSEQTPIGGSSTQLPPGAASLYPAVGGGKGGPTPPPAAQGASPPKARGTGKPSGSKAALPFPAGEAASVAYPSTERRQELAEQAARTKALEKGAKPATSELGAWMTQFESENGRKPTASEITKHWQDTHGTADPLKKEQARALEQMNNGDVEGAKKTLDNIEAVATAKKGKAPTGTSLLATIRTSIDPNAKAGDRDLAKKSIDEYNKIQSGIQMARGKGYAMYRAMYQLGNYLDADSGETVTMSAFDATNAIKNGKSLTHIGQLSTQQIAAAQKFVAESTPAIKEARAYLKAFDSDQDKAVFARVMDELGPPPPGEEVSWLGNVLDQALLDKGLDENGRKLIPRLIRLKETVGSLRQSLGAPATDSSMALMLALIPGPTTPNSAFASDLLDQFENNAKNSVQVPILAPAVKSQMGGKGPTPPPKAGAKPDLSQFDHRPH